MLGCGKLEAGPGVLPGGCACCEERAKTTIEREFGSLGFFFLLLMENENDHVVDEFDDVGWHDHEVEPEAKGAV